MYKIALILLLIPFEDLFIKKECIKLISFNIRYDNPNDGIHKWDNRKDSIAAFYYREKPDIICMQEVTTEQLTYFKLKLSKYKSIGISRNGDEVNGQYTPIFFDTTKYEAIRSGSYSLSENPDKIGSLGWDAKTPRIATWVQLRTLKHHKKIIIINTHLDHRGKKARQNSIDLLLNRTDYNVQKDCIIITGDFNDIPSYISDAMRVKSMYNIIDSFVIAKTKEGVDYSYHKFGKIPLSSRQRIDYVFVNKQISVLNVNIPKENENFFLSDHNPIIVYLKI